MHQFLYFRFERYASKLVPIVIDDLPVSSDPWVLEEDQRNQLVRGLGGASPDDLVIIADVDEVPDPSAVRLLSSCDGWDASGAVHFLTRLYHFRFGIEFEKLWFHPQASIPQTSLPQTLPGPWTLDSGPFLGLARSKISGFSLGKAGSGPSKTQVLRTTPLCLFCPGCGEEASGRVGGQQHPNVQGKTSAGHHRRCGLAHVLFCRCQGRVDKAQGMRS
jgi:hypothetical protein